MRLSPALKVMLWPACRVRVVGLALSGTIHGVASVMFPLACRRICEKESRELGFKVKVDGESPSLTVPEVAVEPEALSVMLTGSINNLPLVQPSIAWPLIWDWMALTWEADIST